MGEAEFWNLWALEGEGGFWSLGVLELRRGERFWNLWVLEDEGGFGAYGFWNVGEGRGFGTSGSWKVGEERRVVLEPPGSEKWESRFWSLWVLEPGRGEVLEPIVPGT